MKLGRVSVGVIAAIVAFLAMFVVQALETRFLGVPSGRSLVMTFLGTGIAVFWLGDRLGLVASAYTEPSLGLSTTAANSGEDMPRDGQDEIRQRLDAMLPPNSVSQPTLLKAVDLAKSDIGPCEWNRLHNADLLTVSDDGQTIRWESKKPTYTGKHYPPAWVPASTRLKLHNGTFQWDFVVEEMNNAQIGVGFMLLWDVGADWGFFGYLGASPTAWAYDPSTGDVVSNTASIQGGLPKFADGRTGVVSVYLELPRSAAGTARFQVNGVACRTIGLPEGAVVQPAACFLKEGQRVRLAGFERT